MDIELLRVMLSKSNRIAIIIRFFIKSQPDRPGALRRDTQREIRAQYSLENFYKNTVWKEISQRLYISRDLSVVELSWKKVLEAVVSEDVTLLGHCQSGLSVMDLEKTMKRIAIPETVQPAKAEVSKAQEVKSSMEATVARRYIPNDENDIPF